MKKISKIISFVASLTLLSQPLTGAMQPPHDDFKTIGEGFFTAKSIFSIEDKTQLKNKIKDFVRSINNNRLLNNEKNKIVEHICNPNHPLMRFCIMLFGINHDETRRNILEILNDCCNSEANISLAEIVENNEVKYLQILALFFSIICYSTN